MEVGNIGRRIRATHDEWAQFGTAVDTAGIGDRSKVTRALWLLYQQQSSVRRAVATLIATPANEAVTVPTPTPSAAALRDQVGKLCAYGQDTAGLNRDDAIDTIMTWLRWYADQDMVLDAGLIETALLARALGQEWRPEKAA